MTTTMRGSEFAASLYPHPYPIPTETLTHRPGCRCHDKAEPPDWHDERTWIATMYQEEICRNLTRRLADAGQEPMVRRSIPCWNDDGARIGPALWMRACDTFLLHDAIDAVYTAVERVAAKAAKRAAPVSQ